ncbi:hypothetical protein LNKW23_10040 [Paralimibaculum aggregatum]|uniref:SPOR domain-containing protein n=1 Tax=Paralimibaculum aggregatum TaxID=3036245 RepID=A0ABQ6LH85_9RHOB|nr:SPOR domain-containing protein [Limibaculum sp. NKW23]GMG81791.1 hypothetical protein LNKW23_10040 [Limibaculum sp. NKW23]
MIDDLAAGGGQPALAGPQVSQGVAAAAEAVEPGPNALIDARLVPVPEEFAIEDAAEWDGERTLQGIWVAHPAAQTARRVRILNVDTGYAVDGALFRRDETGSATSVLVSSDAAAALGMTPGDEVTLSIVAIKRAPVAPVVAAAPAHDAEPEPEPAAQAPAEAASAGAEEGPEEAAEPESAAAGAAAPEPEPEAAETGAGTDGAADAAEGDGAALTALSQAAEPEAAEPAPEPVADEPAGAVEAAEPAADEAPAEAEAPADPDDGATAESFIEDWPLEVDTGAATEAAAPEPALVAEEVLPEAAPSADPAPQPDPAPDTEAAAPAAPAPLEAAVATAAAEPEAGPEIVTEPAPEATTEPAPEVALAQPEQAPPEPEPTPEASPLDRPYIQAGLFGVASNAARLVRVIEEAGFPAEGKVGTYGGRELTRVVAGPFTTAAERDAALREIRRIGPRDAVPVAR